MGRREGMEAGSEGGNGEGREERRKERCYSAEFGQMKIKSLIQKLPLCIHVNLVKCYK